jgi:hypothetical protein
MIEVEVAGRTNYLKGDEVLMVKKDGRAELSVFGNEIPAESALLGRTLLGGVFLWDDSGKSKEGETLSGQKIPKGGLCIRPGKTIVLALVGGSEIEIGIVATGDTPYQMFDELGMAREGDVLRVKST